MCDREFTSRQASGLSEKRFAVSWQPSTPLAVFRLPQRTLPAPEGEKHDRERAVPHWSCPAPVCTVPRGGVPSWAALAPERPRPPMYRAPPQSGPLGSPVVVPPPSERAGGCRCGLDVGCSYRLPRIACPQMANGPAWSGSHEAWDPHRRRTLVCVPVTVSYPFGGLTPLVVAVISLDNGERLTITSPRENNRPMIENAMGWGYAADVKRSRCRRRRAVPVREESPTSGSPPHRPPQTPQPAGTPLRRQQTPTRPRPATSG